MKTKTNIRMLFTIDKSYPFCEGGAEVHAFKLAKGLAASGLKIKILCPQPMAWRPKCRSIDGVTIYELPVPLCINNRSFFKIYNCQLIIALITFWPCYNSLQFFGLSGLKTLIWFANSFHKRYFLKITSQKNWHHIRNLFNNDWARISIIQKYFSGFIVPSHELENLLLADNVPKSYVNYIVNGVTRPALHNKDKKSNRLELCLPSAKALVLYAGRMHPDKNIETLLRAWPIVEQNTNSAHLLILGDGCTRGKLQNLIQELNIQNSVTLNGFVTPEAVYKHLFAADLFVLPSKQEGCSNALLEAMSTGLTCIATDCMGNKEIISNGVDGYLLEPENTGMLAQEIILALSDPKKRESIGARAIQTIKERFSIEETTLKYLNYYKFKITL